MRYRMMTIAVASSLIVACGGTDGNNGSDTKSRTIDGALTSEVTGEGGVDDQVIVASTVDAQGNVSALEDGQSVTDMDGRYSINFSGEVDVDTTLLVQATNADEVLGSVVFRVDANETEDVDAPPITIDSSAEAQVTVQARAQEEGCAFCINGDLERRIDDSVGAMIQESAEQDPAIYAESALAVYAGVQARNEMLISEAVGGTDEALATAASETATAYTKLQSDLVAAGDAEQRETAHRSYAEAYLNAFSNAGFTSAQLAIASHAETAMLVAYGTPSAPIVLEGLRAQVEEFRASYVVATIETRFEEAGLNTDELEIAGEILETEVAAAASADSGIEAALVDAWDAYRTDVNTTLEEQSSLQVTSLLGALDEALDNATEAYSSELAQIDETASPREEADIVVDALIEMNTSIVSDDNVTAMVEAGLSEQESEAYLDILFHLGASAEPTLSN